MIIFDFCAFLLSVVMMVSVLVRYRKIDTLFLLVEISVTLNCMGRFLLDASGTLDSAIWANKLMYIGACYAPPLLIMMLFRLCSLRLPRIAALLMTLYSTVVMGFVMTIGVNGIYYKKVELITKNGYSYLEKEYGPAHLLYFAMMVFYGVFLVAFMVYAVKKRRQFSYRTVASASFMGFFIIAAYCLERILDMGISLLSVGYLVVMLFLIWYFDRLNMYDMSSNVISAVQQRKEYGYIVFDNKQRYISSDGYIKEIFPEIKEWVVDSRVVPSDSLLYTEVVQYFQSMQWQDDEKKVLHANARYFELDIHPISHGKKQVGFLVEFVDRTMEREYYSKIENYNAQLEKEVAAKTANILHIKDMMVLGMAEMVESRDDNTGGHIKRTSAVVRVFSERLKNRCKGYGLTEKFLKQVEKAAPMHDLGKITIDDRILRKPSGFTDEEYAEMKRHPSAGAEIVTNILDGVEDDEFVQIARNVALYHHEKWDGSGYPTGISGTDIPVEARIMALADVFDALVSKRSYKDALSYDEVFSLIEENLGKQFDPQLGLVFLQCREELEAIYRKEYPLA